MWNDESKGKGQKVEVTFAGAGGYVELYGPDMWGDVRLLDLSLANVAGAKFRMKLIISGSNGSASVTFSRAVARCVN